MFASKSRVAALLIGLLLVISAIVQWNDPDPWTWILLYGVSAILSLTYSVRAIVTWWMPAVVAGVSLAWAVTLLPHAFDGESLLSDEQFREAGGLLIVTAWMLTVAVLSRAASQGES